MKGKAWTEINQIFPQYGALEKSLNKLQTHVIYFFDPHKLIKYTEALASPGDRKGGELYVGHAGDRALGS